MFANSEPKYKNYIKATQGGVVRFDKLKTPTTIEGLCTDGTSACLTIIVINNAKTRFSLTHTSLAFKEDSLVNECRWVGSPCMVYFIRGTSYKDNAFEVRSELQAKTLPRLTGAVAKALKDVKFDTTTYRSYPGSVAINRKGNITCLPATIIRPTMFPNVSFKRIGQACPDIELRHAINMINQYSLMLQNSYHALEVQYDAEQWASFPELELCARAWIDKYRQGMKSSIADFNISLIQYLHFESSATLLKQQAINDYGQHRYDAASKLLEQFLTKAQQLWGSEDEKVATVHYNLGACYEKLGNLKEAHDSFSKCVENRKKLFGVNADQTKKAQTGVDRVAQANTPNFQSGK